MGSLDDDHQHGAQQNWHSVQHHHQHGADGSRNEQDKGQADGIRRIELITGRERRRRWSREEKARITALSFAPGANVSEVARINGVSIGLLHTWRRNAREREQANCGEEGLRFVPVVTRVAGEDVGGQRRPCDIELELHGARIRLNGRVDQANLMTVLSAVKATA